MYTSVLEIMYTSVLYILHSLTIPRDVRFARIFNEYFNSDGSKKNIFKQLLDKKCGLFKSSDSGGIPHCYFYLQDYDFYNTVYLKMPHDCYCFYETQKNCSNNACNYSDQCSKTPPNNEIVNALSRYNKRINEIGSSVHRMCHHPLTAISTRIIGLKSDDGDRANEIERCYKHYFEITNLRQTLFQHISGYGAKATGWFSAFLVWITLVVALILSDIASKVLIFIFFIISIIFVWRWLSNLLLQEVAKDCLFICFGIDYDRPERSYDEPLRDYKKNLERYMRPIESKVIIREK